jgi:hypothetical protein|tara:strand:+ start:582 stop:962 length:381 start_codon:yes stop_codon:yes gene_type:complete
MSFSNTFETRVLTWVFTNGTATRPTAWYLGLYTAAPGEGGGGTEVSGGSYAREALALTVSGNAATNGSAIEFTAATASWGTVTYVGIFDASTSGTLIAYSALDTSKTVGIGDILRFSIGDLDVTLD